MPFFAARYASALGVAGACALLLACTPDPIVTPVRNLERPSDMAFACVERLGPEGQFTISGRPMSVCHDPEPGPTAADAAKLRASHPLDEQKRRQFGTFGFLTNTARGEVAAIDMDGDRLVDLDATAPGFNQVPVGSLPEAITVSDDSCSAVTANRGTCDLSVIDVSNVIARYFVEPSVTANSRGLVTQLKVRTAAGNLSAQPRDVTFLPSTTMPPASTCATSPAGEVLVTFPNCSLVAVVAIDTGEIRSSLRVMPDGTTVDAGANPVCPSDCGATVGAVSPPVDAAPAPADAAPPLPRLDAASDAAAGGDTVADAGDDARDAGADDVLPPLPVPPAGPSGTIAGLAVMPGGMRAFVGMAESPFVVAFDLSIDASTGGRRLVALGTAGRISLAENPVGITRLRLSVDPFAAGGGAFVGTRGWFLYAFARDGSVRVLDVVPRSTRAGEECEVNAEEASVIPKDVGCVPLASRAERQLLAKGPGLRVPATLQTDVEPPIPVDIAFAEVGALATGFLLTSNGQVIHIGLGLSKGGPEGAEDTLPTHWPRRSAGGAGDGRAGGVPTAFATARNFNITEVAFPTKVSPEITAGPRLEGFAGASGQRVYAAFPEGMVPPQGVRIEWQGTLAGATRINGRLAVGAPESGGVASLTDLGANFCRAGVEAGDIVSLVGCSVDSNCDALRDEVCHRAVPGGPGVCVPRALANDEARVGACRLEFSSRRRYEVREASRTSLVLGLKIDEVPRPAVAPCQLGPGNTANLDPVCQPDPSHGVDARLSLDRPFACHPFSDGRARCAKFCGTRAADGSLQIDPGTGRPVVRDELCRPGHVCADVGEAALGPFCVEAPAPKPECLTGELRYAVHVGNAFLVQSESLPRFVAQVEETPGGRCIPVPNRDPRLTDRIRFDAAVCATSPGADLATFVRQPLPGPTNPCFFRSANLDEPLATDPGGLPPLKALFRNPYMTFVLTDVADYVGDAALISFQVEGGFAPLLVSSTRPGDADVALGTRILTGPMASRDRVSGAPISPDALVPVPPYLFVIDQGRTLRELSRGQLLRLNPRPWSAGPYEGGFFDSFSTDTTWPIQ